MRNSKPLRLAPEVSFSGPLGLPLAFGTWAIGGTDWGPFPVGPAKSLLRHAWEVGFRHFDTAEAYGTGRSEQLLGQALRQVIRGKREELVLADKSVVRDPRSLETHLTRSLRRLGTSYIDLFYIHWPRRGVSLLRAVEELHRQVDRGLIRAVGLCNVTAEEYTHVATRLPVSVVQAGYNALWRKPERDLWPTVGCTRAAYSPLAQGLLARPFSYTVAWEPEDHRQKTPLFSRPAWDSVHAFNSGFTELCRKAELSPAAVALTWLLRAPGYRSNEGLDREADTTLPSRSAPVARTDFTDPRVHAAVVGGRREQQLTRLVSGLDQIRSSPGNTRYLAIEGAIEDLYARVAPYLPEVQNIFGYVPRPASRKNTLGNSPTEEA